MQYIIEGGLPLKGVIELQGSKNGALPLLAGALITRSKIRLNKIPHLSDIDNFLLLAHALGAVYSWKESSLVLDATSLTVTDLDADLIAKIRASSYLIPVLASLSTNFTFPRPGGCSIGSRPLDYHLKALKKLGIDGQEKVDRYAFEVKDLHPATIELPFPSFGATINAVLMASTIPGVTTIVNSAQEPEVHQLTDFLRLKGVDITWLASTIVISGRKNFAELEEFTNSGDRIAAATYLLLATSAGSAITLKDVPVKQMKDILDFFDKASIDYDIDRDSIRIWGSPINPKLSIAAEPFPGFSTDILPLLIPVFAVSKGLAVLKDKVYPHRERYLEELKKFDANIVQLAGDIIVLGSTRLKPANITATDLRGGAAGLMLASFISGRSSVEGAEILDRGYENLIDILKSVGLKIEVKR